LLIAIMVGEGALFPVELEDRVGDMLMRDDEARLDWYNCGLCDGLHTWFRVDVIEGIVMYGWLHQDEHRECPRNTGLNWLDFRNNIRGYDHMA